MLSYSGLGLRQQLDHFATRYPRSLVALRHQRQVQGSVSATGLRDRSQYRDSSRQISRNIPTRGY
jgi:hypothetical protein